MYIYFLVQPIWQEMNVKMRIIMGLAGVKHVIIILTSSNGCLNFFLCFQLFYLFD